jgi:hypothetical protein
MKKFLIGSVFVFAFLVVSLKSQPGVIRTNVTLTWLTNVNTPSPDFIYKLYSTTNLSVSLTNWPIYATFSGTNTGITLPIDSNQRWFVLTASNWWGETFFSNVTNTPPILRYDLNLRLGQ